MFLNDTLYNSSDDSIPNLWDSLSMASSDDNKSIFLHATAYDSNGNSIPSLWDRQSMSSSDDEWDATSYSTWGSENDQALAFNGYNTDETSSTKESTKGSNALTSTGSDVPSLISRQHSNDSSVESNSIYNKE
eukprot:1186851-Ditylum_brightwellii.AAC.1